MAVVAEKRAAAVRFIESSAAALELGPAAAQPMPQDDQGEQAERHRLGFLALHSASAKRQHEEDYFRKEWVNGNNGRLARHGGWGLDRKLSSSPTLVEAITLPRGKSLGVPVQVVDEAIPRHWCMEMIRVNELVGFTSQEKLDDEVGSPEKLATSSLIRGVREQAKLRGTSGKPVVVSSWDAFEAGDARKDKEDANPVYGLKNTAEVLEITSNEFADMLWAQVSPFVAPTLTHADAVYEVAGIIPTFRFMRYAGGQAFRAHVDPSRFFVADPRTGDKGVFKSFITVALYLNDAEEFDGGALNFVELVKNPHFDCQKGGPPMVYRSCATVQPKQGRVAIFEHRAVHEAGAVPRGVKHMMQCDVLYRRTDVSSL